MNALEVVFWAGSGEVAEVVVVKIEVARRRRGRGRKVRVRIVVGLCVVVVDGGKVVVVVRGAEVSEEGDTYPAYETKSKSSRRDGSERSEDKKAGRKGKRKKFKDLSGKLVVVKANPHLSTCKERSLFELQLWFDSVRAES